MYLIYSTCYHAWYAWIYIYIYIKSFHVANQCVLIYIIICIRPEYLFDLYMLALFSIWYSSFHNFHFSPYLNFLLFWSLPLSHLQKTLDIKTLIIISHVGVFHKWDDDMYQNDNKFKNLRIKMKTVKFKNQIENVAELHK